MSLAGESAALGTGQVEDERRYLYGSLGSEGIENQFTTPSVIDDWAVRFQTSA
jgi:hypothetical protein